MTMLKPSAMDVLRMDLLRSGDPGHVAGNRPMPRVERMAPATASCLQPATEMRPRNAADAAKKHIVETPQKGNASTAADRGLRRGESQVRMVTFEAEGPERAWASVATSAMA